MWNKEPLKEMLGKIPAVMISKEIVIQEIDIHGSKTRLKNCY